MRRYHPCHATVPTLLVCDHPPQRCPAPALQLDRLTLEPSTPDVLQTFAKDLRRLAAIAAVRPKAEALKTLTATTALQASRDLDNPACFLPVDSPPTQGIQASAAGSEQQHDSSGQDVVMFSGAQQAPSMVMVDMLCMLLFARHSRGLHRQLLAAARALPPPHRERLCSAAAARIAAAAAAASAALAAAASQETASEAAEHAMAAALQLAAPIASLLTSDRLKSAVQRCAAPAAACLARALLAAAVVTSPSPAGASQASEAAIQTAIFTPGGAFSLEEFSDAVAGCHHIMTHFGGDMAGAGGAEAVALVAQAMLTILKVT